MGTCDKAGGPPDSDVFSDWILRYALEAKPVESTGLLFFDKICLICNPLDFFQNEEVSPNGSVLEPMDG